MDKKKNCQMPFMLKPFGMNYLWGGTRLSEDFSKDMEGEKLAETWECSTHSDGPSSVASGEYAGMLLKDVLKLHPEYAGTHPTLVNGELPILIKFIDAKENLSIQVHPNDEYATIYENGASGKDEMWYVLDAKKDSQLIHGFKYDMCKEVIRKSIEDGTIEKYLQKISVEKDDVFYIPAGRVHAIGAGTLIVEIQENSNLTYRLYDYGRIDKCGNKRELHIEKALDVIDLMKSDKPRQPMRTLKFKPGFATELLCRCKYFEVERMLLNTERCKQMAEIATSSISFQVLLCISGCGTLFWKNDYTMSFFQGDCIFVPANTDEIKLHGKATMLRVYC